MSAATQSIDTPVRNGLQIQFPVGAAKKIYAGTLVALNATGYAVPAADTAGLRVIGRAEQEIDNSAGADGDLTINVTRGIFRYDNSGTHAFTKADIGKRAYVEDDSTVASQNTHGVTAGIIVDFDSDGVWVDTTRANVVPTSLAQTSVNNTTAAATDLATAEALANALKSQGNALVVDVAAIIAILKANGLTV